MSRNNSFGCWLLRYLALMLFGFAIYEAYTFPVFGVALVVGLGVYALALAIEVRVWLLVLPTAIAVLSIGFWSGRYFWDAFDLFMLVTLAGGLWCCRVDWTQESRPGRLWPLALFAVLQVGITLNGLYPLESPVPGLWADYFASTNALREAKGVAWALLLVPMLMQAQRIGTGAVRWLVAGMAIGLSALFLAILWERNLYTGVLNFASPYRVSGSFFDLHTGGAAIDIALAMMLPFLFGLSLWWRKWPMHLVTLGLLVLTAYGLLVTFSRANYLAIAVIGLVLLAGLLTLPGTPRRRLRRWPWVPAVAVVAVVAMVPVLVGGTILERFRSTSADIQVRLDHWSESAGLVAPGMQTLYGIGKGAFPRHYHLGRTLDGEALSTLFLHGSGPAAFVRINASDDAGLLDLRQRFRPRGTEASLHLVLRTPPGHRERLLVEFCERQVLRVRAECRWVGTNVADNGGEWQEYVSPVKLAGLGDGGILQRSPVDISILNRGIANRIDVKSVRLVAADGSELLHNTAFEHGLDRWYMVDGNHLRWHVKNIFVFSYVEGGLIGLAAFVLIAALGLLRGWRLHRQGDPAGLLFVAAIAGGLTIGLFDSVLDAPRVTVLFLLPLFAALVWQAEPLAVSNRLRRYGFLRPRRFIVVPLVVIGVLLGAGAYRIASGPDRPGQLLVHGMYRLGMDPAAVFDWVSGAPAGLDSQLDLHPVAGQRRIWRRLTAGTEKVQCASGDFRHAAVCWAIERDVTQGRLALGVLRDMHDTRPRTFGDYGNGWLMAVLFDLLSDHPDMSPALRSEMQQRLRQQLRQHLLLLNSEGPAVWHGRTTLAAQAMIIAASLDATGPHDAALLQQAHFHYLELLESLAAVESWPEGYNYWVNSRGFLVALAAFAYAEAFPGARGQTLNLDVMSRIGLWHIHSSRPDFQAVQVADEGPRIDQRDETQRIVDALALVTGESRLVSFSNALERRFRGAGYYHAYRWLRPLLRGWAGPAALRPEAVESPRLSEWFGRDAMNQFYLRSDWGDEATVISFRAGHTLSHHGHADAGHFTLYKGSPLAVTGATGKGILDAPHRIDYGARTVSKNSLLVMRPGERVQPAGYAGENVADGGQRLPMPLRNPLTDLASWRANIDAGLHLEGGSIVAHQHRDAEYTYIRADITAAYNTARHDEGGVGGKVDLVERHLLYLRRLDRLLLFDRVLPVDPAYKAKWLLQSEVRPEFRAGVVLRGSSNDGIIATADKEFLFANGVGRLHLQSLLPLDGETLVVGGDNNRFYVDIDGDAATLDGRNMDDGAWTPPWFEAARWRLEIGGKPGSAGQDFLTLLSPSIGSYRPPRAARLRAMPDGVLAVQIDDELIVFVVDDAGSGFDLPAAADVTRVRVLGLPPGGTVQIANRDFPVDEAGSIDLESLPEFRRVRWSNRK